MELAVILIFAAFAALDLWLSCRALDRRIEQPEKGGP